MTPPPWDPSSNSNISATTRSYPKSFRIWSFRVLAETFSARRNLCLKLKLGREFGILTDILKEGSFRSSKINFFLPKIFWQNLTFCWLDKKFKFLKIWRAQGSNLFKSSRILTFHRANKKLDFANIFLTKKYRFWVL